MKDSEDEPVDEELYDKLIPKQKTKITNININ